MSESERRRDDERPEDPVRAPVDGSGYTAEEEAEVQKRLEDLGYVE
jgi:hypothetical protein